MQGDHLAIGSGCELHVCRMSLPLTQQALFNVLQHDAVQLAGTSSGQCRCVLYGLKLLSTKNRWFHWGSTLELGLQCFTEHATVSVGVLNDST